MIDLITLVIFLAVPWGLLGIWQLVLLWLRNRGEHVRLISQVARDKAFHLSPVAYLYTSMPAHWWWNGPHWADPWSGYVYWALPLGLLVWSIFTWRTDPATWPRWRRVVRHPVLWIALGPLAGRYLFPQAGPLPWGLP